MDKPPEDRIRGETAIAHRAFLCYLECRDLKVAYNQFMQDNPDALTSFNVFVKWGGLNNWQKRANEYSDWQEVRDQRETRLLGRKNALSAEEMAAELFTCVREQMEFKKESMTHSDMARYLAIGEKITARWIPKESPVTVNVDVDQTVNNVEVPDAVLRALGRKLTEENDEDSS